MKQSVRPNTKAFTLIELSIVLVVIGLLVGGVLVGQDLIRAAKVRNVISEQERIKTAYNTFRLKYNCLPGDCANATQFFSGVVNGTGDSYYTNGLNLGSSFYEAQLFWRELALAGLIDGDFTGKRSSGAQAFIFGGSNATEYPTSYEVRAGYSAEYYNAYGLLNANVLRLHGQKDDGTLWSGANIIRAIDAFNIDTKVDDGKPGLGKVIGHVGGDRLNNYGVACHTGGNLNTPALQSSAVYYKNTINLCSMSFQLN